MFIFLKKLIRETYSHSRTFKLWLPVIYTLYLTIIAIVLSYGIGFDQLLPGYSPAEIDVAKITAGWPHPLENFLYWPYYIAVYLLRFIIEDGVLAARLMSSLFALTAVASFLILLRRRFGIFVSLAGTSLFALNSWFLQIARSGTAEITLISTALILLVCIFAIPNISRSQYLKIGTMAVVFLAWFTPLIPWLISAICLHLFYRQRMIKRYLSFKLRSALLSLMLILVVWTGLVFANHQNSVTPVTGVPNNLPNLQEIGANLSQTVQSIFWRAPDNAQQWLAHFPLLDVFTAALIPFGLYAFWRYRQRVSFKYCLAILSGLLLIAALNRGITTPGLMLIIPLLIATAAMGLHEILDHWKKLFPRNPLARILSLSVLLVLVSMSIFYQSKRYFIAWTNHTETQQIYSLEEQK